MSASLLKLVLLGDWISDTMSAMQADHRFALIVVMIGCATGVVCTAISFISHTINSIHRRRIEAEMKREMIDRGMSADEIAKIIEAAAPPEDGTQRWIASWARKSKSS